jgi:hypothetical protein
LVVKTAVSHIPEFGDAASPAEDVEDVHLQWETTASPNFEICDTNLLKRRHRKIPGMPE